MVFLPLRPFDKCNHPVEKGGALRRGDANLDLVGKNSGAACNRGAVAALASHWCGFAGDRRLVDRCDPFDHTAIARNEIAGVDEESVPNLQLDCGHAFDTVLMPLLLLGSMSRFAHVSVRLSQRGGLGLSAAFGQGLSEICEKQGGHCDPAEDV